MQSKIINNHWQWLDMKWVTSTMMGFRLSSIRERGIILHAERTGSHNMHNETTRGPLSSMEE
jgi:hypothetical protein